MTRRSICSISTQRCVTWLGQRPALSKGAKPVPVLRNAAVRMRETLFFALSGVQRAVQDQRCYKLIEYVVDGARTTQLFDLHEDPWNCTTCPHAPTTCRRSQLCDQRCATGDRSWMTHSPDRAPSSGRASISDESTPDEVVLPRQACFRSTTTTSWSTIRSTRKCAQPSAIAKSVA